MHDNKLPKWPFISTGVIVVLAILFSVMARQMNAVPTISIPTPVMPSPNAYDFYTQAQNSICDKAKIEFAFNEDPRTPRPGGPSTPGQPYSLSEKEAIVKSNATALSILRKGFACEYLNPPCRSFNASFRNLSQDRIMARLLLLESQVMAAHGKWGGAMDSCLDALRLGQDIPRGGPLITALVGVAVQSIGRKNTWDMVDKLNLKETQAAILRMEDILSRQVSFADTMQEEKWTGEASIIEMFGQPGWRSQLLSYAGGSGRPVPQNISEAVELAKSLTWSKGRTINCYSSYMDEYVKRSRTPYAAMPNAAPPQPNDPIVQLLCPVFEKARFVEPKAETQNVLLTITLALHAYKLEHGQFPVSLSELMPYPWKTLSDPFALKGAPRYKRIGARYILYSVGPDCKDDGGKAIFDKTQVPPPGAPPSQQHRPYTTLPDSKGDVVAGVNI